MKQIASSDPARYETWKLSHNCNLNYTSPSPGMEKAGATKIFSLSEEKHGLYYISSCKDGDSKTYSAATYAPSKPVKKFECVSDY